MQKIELEILGSGTSTGVPLPACPCAVCNSSDSLDKRLRVSLAIKSGQDCIVIDTGPDFRAQVLRSRIKKICAVLYTHTHADHIFGIDDLRAFNYAQKSEIPLYASKNSAEILRKTFSYIFEPDPEYLGGALPKLCLKEIRPFEEFSVAGIKILPLPLKHGNMEVLGFRIGNFAYLTDCNEIPEESLKHLENLDCLIIDGLREREHKTHMNFKKAIEEIEKLKPNKSYLTHIAHETSHKEGNLKIRELSSLDIELAYDGLKLSVR